MGVCATSPSRGGSATSHLAPPVPSQSSGASARSRHHRDPRSCWEPHGLRCHAGAGANESQARWRIGHLAHGPWPWPQPQARLQPRSHGCDHSRAMAMAAAAGVTAAAPFSYVLKPVFSILSSGRKAKSRKLLLLTHSRKPKHLLNLLTEEILGHLKQRSCRRLVLNFSFLSCALPPDPPISRTTQFQCWAAR